MLYKSSSPRKRGPMITGRLVMGPGSRANALGRDDVDGLSSRRSPNEAIKRVYAGRLLPVFAGDTVTLRQEGCFTDGVGYRFHDNVYRYTLSGDTLRFSVVRNACADRFAQSILTSRTFRRAS